MSLYTDEQLVRRFLSSFQMAPRGRYTLRGAVMRAFGVGFTVAGEICSKYGHQPDLIVKQKRIP